MKPAVALFYLLAAVIFVQLLTGGLRVFGFLDEGTHIIAGFVTFLLAIVTLIATTFTKPRFRPAIVISSLLVLLIFIQGLLGFEYLNSNDLGVITVHYVNALLIYGLAISGVFTTMRWNAVTTAKTAPSPR